MKIKLHPTKIKLKRKKIRKPKSSKNKKTYTPAKARKLA